MRRYAHGQKERLLAVQKLHLLVGERLNYVNLIDYGDKVSDRHNENVQKDTDAVFTVDGAVITSGSLASAAASSGGD